MVQFIPSTTTKMVFQNDWMKNLFAPEVAATSHLIPGWVTPLVLIGPENSRLFFHVWGAVFLLLSFFFIFSPNYRRIIQIHIFVQKTKKILQFISTHIYHIYMYTLIMLFIHIVISFIYLLSRKWSFSFFIIYSYLFIYHWAFVCVLMFFCFATFFVFFEYRNVRAMRSNPR